METVRIDKYCFKYDSNDMFCFEDKKNKRIAFIQDSEIQLIIDIVNNNLTFHPDVRVNIYELDENTYRIESFFEFFDELWFNSITLWKKYKYISLLS